MTIKTLFCLLASLFVAPLMAAGAGADVEAAEPELGMSGVCTVTPRQQAMAEFIRAASAPAGNAEKVKMLVRSLKIDPTYRAPLLQLSAYSSKPELGKVIGREIFPLAQQHPEQMLLVLTALQNGSRAGIDDKALFDLNRHAVEAVAEPERLGTVEQAVFARLLEFYLSASVVRKEAMPAADTVARLLDECKGPLRFAVLSVAARFYHDAGPQFPEARRWFWLLPGKRAEAAESADAVWTELLNAAGARNREEQRMLFEMALRQKRHETALSLAEKMTPDGDGDFEPSLRRAWALILLNRPAEARMLLTGLPAGGMREELELMLAAQTQDWGTLRTKLVKALQALPPGKPIPEQVLFGLLQVAERTGDKEVLAQCRKASEERGMMGDPQVANSLGYVEAELGVNLEKAEKAIRTAVEADPGNSAYLDSLAWVLYRRGRLEEAQKTIEQAVARDRASRADGKVNPVMLAHAGEIAMKLGELEKARRLLREALTGEDPEFKRAEAEKLLEQLERNR